MHMECPFLLQSATLEFRKLDQPLGMPCMLPLPKFNEWWYDLFTPRRSQFFIGFCRLFDAFGFFMRHQSVENLALSRLDAWGFEGYEEISDHNSQKWIP